MKILMVCLGNICRSPLAEGIMQAKADASGLHWQIDSAGTGNWHAGQAPDSRAIAVAKKYKIDISQQKARQIQKSDFVEFDHIFVMDQSNYTNVLALAPDEAAKLKVSMIMDQMPNAPLRQVPDPYYDDQGFEQVFRMLDQACTVFVHAFGK
jgi:protein-tyrosine phosphatase